MPSGSWGRKRNTDNVGIDLRYAVENGGASEDWLPINASKRRDLLGSADSAESRLTPPVSSGDQASVRNFGHPKAGQGGRRWLWRVQSLISFAA